MAQSRRPVASKVALDLLYWAMRLAPYRLNSIMAIEMAPEAGACFSFDNFMSCITIAKRPCCGPLKTKPSYNIVSLQCIDLVWLMTFISCAMGSGEKIIEEEAKNACARHSGIRLSIIDKVDNSLPCTTCNTLRYDLSWGLLYRRLLHSPVSWAHGAQPRLRLPWPCWPWLSRCISRPAFSRYSRGPLAWPSETWERSCALVS